MSRLTAWDHLVLSCFMFSLVAWVVTVWCAFVPADITWAAVGAAFTGHLWALAGLVYARNHDW